MRDAVGEMCASLRAAGMADGALDVSCALVASATGASTPACDEIQAAIVLSDEMVHREEFLVWNPTHFTVTADSSTRIKDGAGFTLATVKLHEFTLAGRDTGTLVLEIGGSYLKQTVGRAIVNQTKMRQLVCLFEEPEAERDVCAKLRNHVYLHVTLRATVLNTSIEVPLPVVALKGASLFAETNATGCECWVGDEESGCKEDISGLTIASLV